MSELSPVPLQVAYTVEEACRQLGCKRTTLYLAISNRYLDARKIGTRTVITGASLAAYLESRPKANIACKPRERACHDLRKKEPCAR